MTKVRTALDELGDDGSFKREDAAWRNWISREPGVKFPPEKDRYHLFVAYACPVRRKQSIVVPLILCFVEHSTHL